MRAACYAGQAAQGSKCLAFTSWPALNATARIRQCQASSSREIGTALTEPRPTHIVFRRYPWNYCWPDVGNPPLHARTAAGGSG